GLAGGLEPLAGGSDRFVAARDRRLAGRQRLAGALGLAIDLGELGLDLRASLPVPLLGLGELEFLDLRVVARLLEARDLGTRRFERCAALRRVHLGGLQRALGVATRLFHALGALLERLDLGLPR